MTTPATPMFAKSRQKCPKTNNFQIIEDNYRDRTKTERFKNRMTNECIASITKDFLMTVTSSEELFKVWLYVVQSPTLLCSFQAMES